MRKPKRLDPAQIAPFIFEPPDPAEPVNWETIFGNDRPVEIEVGFGKGAFLVHAAEREPATNFFGIEIERKYYFYVAGRLARRDLRDARACCADGRAFLRDRVPDASVAVVHVYFPDPWWKNRHRKRRVFTPEFARDCRRVLALGGELSIATDVEEYFDVMTGIVEPMAGFERIETPEWDVVTNFERKAIENGGSVYRARYRREPAAEISPPDS